MFKNKVFELVAVLEKEPVEVKRLLAVEIGKSVIQIHRYYSGATIPDDTKIALCQVITEMGVKCKVKDLGEVKKVNVKIKAK